VNADWFYSDGDKRMGPVTDDELRRMADAGTLGPNDLVWRDGMADWAEARSVGILFPYAQPVKAEADERPSRRRFDPEDRAAPARHADDERPSRRGQDELDDDRPRIRRPAADDDGRDRDYDRPRRPAQKPGQIQAVGIMMLVGGILGILVFLSYAATCIGLVWPGIYFELVVGILAIIRGINMLNQDDQGPPKTLAILLIICIVNLDVINCVLGIVSLVLLNDPQVQAHYRRKGFAA
jgi:hypothetical protein